MSTKQSLHCFFFFFRKKSWSAGELPNIENLFISFLLLIKYKYEELLASQVGLIEKQ